MLFRSETYVNELKNKVGSELMRTHKSYWPALKKLIDGECISAMAHITGGGITENLNRILPENCQAEVQLGSWPVIPLCRVMAEIGHIDRDEMLRATNMGIGMVLVVRPSNVGAVTATLKTPYYQIGRIIPGEPRVSYRQ